MVTDIPIPLQIHLNPRIHTSLLFKNQSKSSSLQSKSLNSYLPIGLTISSARIRIPDSRYQVRQSPKQGSTFKSYSTPHARSSTTNPQGSVQPTQKQGSLSLSLLVKNRNRNRLKKTISDKSPFKTTQPVKRNPVCRVTQPPRFNAYLSPYPARCI